MLLAQVVDIAQAKEYMTETNYTTTGVVIVILIAVGLATWRVLSWLGKEVVIPGRDRMFRHLDCVDETFKDMSTSMQKLATVPEKLVVIENKVDGLTQRVNTLDEHLNSKREQL